MKNVFVLICSFAFSLSFLISCTKDQFGREIEQYTLVSAYEDYLGPITINDIIFGGWKGANHSQGICFNENSLLISCTKQLIKYDLILDKVIEERKCSDLSEEDCDSFHYRDPTFNKSDLWIPYSSAGKWNKNVNCSYNEVLLFPSAKISKDYSPYSYPVDYPGHIGAIEVIDDKLYVSGRNIGPGWPYDDSCHEELIIFEYNIKELKQGSCNPHNDAIILNTNGRNGIQTLSKFDEEHLLVTMYKCEDDPENYVYLLNINSRQFSLYQKENWAYGVAIRDNRLLYFCEDSRKSKAIQLRGIRIN